MNSLKFPSWPTGCCDAWFPGTLLCQVGHSWPVEADGLLAGDCGTGEGASSRGLTQMLLSFDLGVKFQIGWGGATRELAPNKIVTS